MAAKPVLRFTAGPVRVYRNTDRTAADIGTAYAIIAAAKPFNIIIHDHIIVSKNGT